MKNRGMGTVKIILIIAVVIVIGSVGAYAMGGGDTTEKLKISGSTTVRPLAKTWRDKYMNEHADIQISVSGGGSGQGVADVLEGRSEIGMSSSESLIDQESGLVKHVVAYDGIMVIINKNFSGYDALMEQGISKSTLQKIYSGEITNWNEVPGIDLDQKLFNYTRSESSGTAETFAGFLGTTQGELDGAGQTGNSGVKQAVEQNKNSLAFIGAAYAFSGNIEEVPIDGNNDGQLDDAEITEDYEGLKSDINDYPIKRGLYFATKGETTGAAEEFIEWCTDEGQQYVSEIGYIPVTST